MHFFKKYFSNKKPLSIWLERGFKKVDIRIFN